MGDLGFSLDKNWKVREVEPYEVADFAQRLLPPAVSQGAWLSARVPGSVHLDLIAGHRMPNPFKGDNVRTSTWVEKQDFVYKTSFLFPVEWEKRLSQSDQCVELTFDGLDTFATIYLNGEYLGESSNQFLPLTLDITRRVRPGENVLIVHFDSTVKRCTQREIEYGKLAAEHDRSRVYARREQFLTGWSMTPRLSGCGMTGNVTVRRVNLLRLQSVSFPISMLSGNQARFSLETNIESLTDRTIDLEYTIDRLDPVGSGSKYNAVTVAQDSKRLGLRMGNFKFAPSVKLDDPALWWPLGYGQGRRQLYRLRMVARLDGEILDELETHFGLRKVELITANEQGGFHFEINGQPVYARGAIWVPPDIFHGRASDSHVRRLLDQAAAANINMLRVWGGGRYESEAFYRRCDELGIMVWQDFMFTRGEYPDYQAFWQNVQREATHQIKRLRNHPSLVVWCGNDAKEWSDYERRGNWDRQKGSRIFSRMLGQLCSKYDSTRPYWQSSPFGGENPNSPDQGDHHAEVWNNWDAPAKYRDVRARFISSFGFQALPSEECIQSFTSEVDHTLNHPDFDLHQLQSDGNARLFRYIVAHLRPPESFEELVYFSQWVQANALSSAIDAWRAAKPQTMGSLVWHFNDCWPGITWSLVDYLRNPKLAYWAVRQAYMPISLIMMNAEDGLHVVIVHDGPRNEGLQKLVCRLKAYQLTGELIDWRDTEVELAAGGKVDVGLFSYESLSIQDPRRTVIVGELCAGRTVLASKLFSPVEPKKAPYPEPELTCQLDCVLAGARGVFMVRAKNVVRCVELRFKDMPEARIRFENGFDIWPSREVWITADLPLNTPREKIMESMQFRCLNDSVFERNIIWHDLPVREGGESRADDTMLDAPVIAARLRTSDVVPKLKD